MSYDAAVVGAGIVGAWCARELADAGLRVALIDGGPTGGGATGAGMGHIVAMDDSPALLSVTQDGKERWQFLSALLPTEAEYRETGTLWVAADRDERSAATQKAGALGGTVVDDVRSEVPELREGLAGGLLVSDDAVVYPSVVSRWLRESNLRGRIESVPRRAARLEAQAVVLDNETRITADRVVNAAGNGAPQLTPGLAIRPRKGHLAITTRRVPALRHQILELGYAKSAAGNAAETVAFNVQPRATGQWLIGSSRQYGDTSPDVVSGVLSKMLARCAEYLPGLPDLELLRVWTGFRAATPDKVPLVGQATNGVWVCAGHEGLGITTAPATARLLADLVLGRAPALEPNVFAPDRFGETGGW